MMMNAMAEATPWVAIVGERLGQPGERRLRSGPASAGSPIQPRPSEARVMPSWVAEM